MAQTALDVAAGICVFVGVVGLLVRDVRDLDAVSWFSLAALLHFWIR